jgi:hypothetical protein
MHDGAASATVNAIIGAGNMEMTDFVDALGTGILPVDLYRLRNCPGDWLPSPMGRAGQRSSQRRVDH